MFQGCFEGSLRMVLKFSNLFQGVFRDNLWEFQGCFNHVLRVFLAYLEGVQRVFRGCFKNAISCILWLSLSIIKYQGAIRSSREQVIAI